MRTLTVLLLIAASALAQCDMVLIDGRALRATICEKTATDRTEWPVCASAAIGALTGKPARGGHSPSFSKLFKVVFQLP